MYHSLMENRYGTSRSKGRGQAAKKHGVELGSIAILALCVFTFFSLVSYHPGDPSFLSNSSSPAQNLCGLVGAELSALILQWFGMGAFLIPSAFLFVAATLHRREGSARIFGTLAGMSLAVMSLTVFLSLQWKYWPMGGTLLLTGGVTGAWLSDILNHQFNPLGSSIVSLLVFSAAISLSTPVSVAKLAGQTITLVFRWMWQLSKIIAGYLVYFSTLMLVKLARGSADGLQGLAREIAMKMEERRRKKALMGESVASIHPIEVGPPAFYGAEDSDDDGDVEDHVQLRLNSNPSEAPNALPELEQASRLAKSPSALASAIGGFVPQIMPREMDAHPGENKNTAAKAVAKLSRAALRSRKGHWALPTIEFLRKPPKIESQIDRERLLANSQILKQKFADFGIDGEVTAVRPGPVITLYEFKPGPGVKVSRIASLADDLSMALSAQSVRILAPLPGKSVVGIEIPSDTREIVYLREFLQHPDFYGAKHSIPVVMGKDISGQTYLSDLARMPHLLCAGQTGSGKSVFMNGLICSLFYRFTPDELRMILVD
ncbi:MAG: DNA translocase FtsK 4TM domain-containing protein, partial [Bdellovibrionota bacterium]